MDFQSVYENNLVRLKEQYDLFSKVNENPNVIFTEQFSNTMGKHYNLFYTFITKENSNITVHTIQKFLIKQCNAVLQEWLQANYPEKHGKIFINPESMSYPSRLRIKSKDGGELVRFDIYSQEFLDARYIKTKEDFEKKHLRDLEHEQGILDRLKEELSELEKFLKSPIKTALVEPGVKNKMIATSMSFMYKIKSIKTDNAFLIQDKKNHLESVIEEREKTLSKLSWSYTNSLKIFELNDFYVSIIREFFESHNYKVTYSDSFY